MRIPSQMKPVPLAPNVGEQKARDLQVIQERQAAQDARDAKELHAEHLRAEEAARAERVAPRRKPLKPPARKRRGNKPANRRTPQAFPAVRCSRRSVSHGCNTDHRSAVRNSPGSVTGSRQAKFSHTYAAGFSPTVCIKSSRSPSHAWPGPPSA